MRYFALEYDVVRGFAERRVPFRQAHLQLLRDAHDRGALVLAGALGEPPDGALLVFRGESASAVEVFARADPYVREGLVTAWRVRPWTVVIGGDSEPPKAL
jgi:uncharacterized protein YciI